MPKAADPRRYEAARLYNAGKSLRDISVMLDKPTATVAVWVHAHCKMRGALNVAGAGTRTSIDRDAAALVAQIPRDTRPLSGRICGDPLPGRSALDRRAG